MSLRIGIDARVRPGAIGGIAQAVLSIVHTLGELDGPEEYVVVVDSDDGRDFVEPHLGPNQRLVQIPGWRQPTLLERVAARIRPPRGIEIPVSNGLYEGLVDVVHFPHQAFMRTELPSIYNPWDLQHRHFPEFFSEETLAWRETVYREACETAHTVVATSRWVADDFVAQLSLPPEKVQVIPMGPPTAAYEEPSPERMAEVRRTRGLSRPFVLYPAVAWPHKNHIALLEALARVRAEGVDLDLVCTGSTDAPAFPAIEAAVERLGLTGHVHILGYVEDSELRVLYRLAAALVMPSLHESDSFPVFEAWHEGLPVLSSDVTSLPDQVGSAGLLFDPTPDGIADALLRFAREPGLADDLRARGTRRLRDYSWERTARAYRATYRRAAGRQLDDEDRALLSWDWMTDPRP